MIALPVEVRRGGQACADDKRQLLMKPHIEALLEYSESMLVAANAAETSLKRVPDDLRTESQETIETLRGAAKNLQSAVETVSESMTVALLAAQTFTRVQLKVAQEVGR
jgi:hypothetical protein